MINRTIAQQLLMTRYLIERDCLSASFSRMGSGFTPPTVLLEARQRITNIQHLVDKMEKIAEVPKEQIVARDYHHLVEGGCCPKK